MRRNPFVLVISGPSGAGKSTFVKRLLQHHADLRFSISATTRPVREGERDGRDYHFWGDADFQERIRAGAFLEYAEVHGARYGTLRSEVFPALDSGLCPLLDIDVQGGLRVKQELPDAVLVFLLAPTMRIQEGRLRGRGTEPEDKIQRRLAAAADEIRCLSRYDYVVVNNAIDVTEADLEAVVRAERLRRHRLTDSAGGPDVAEEYLRDWARPPAP